MAVGAQQGRDAWGPGREFCEERGGRVAVGDAVGEDFQGGVDDVTEGARGKRALGPGEGGVAGGSGAIGIAIGQFVGAGCGETGGGIECEREALQVAVRRNRGCGEVEDVRGFGDTTIIVSNPGLRTETWGTPEIVDKNSESAPLNRV